MCWVTENHFLFVGLLDWGNAETPTFLVSRNLDGFALAESQTGQEGQRCPKRRVTQAAIRLATAVITFGNKERNVRSPS